MSGFPVGVLGSHQESEQLPFPDCGQRHRIWKATEMVLGYKAFECIPVRFLFWEGDEEFPAQGNILFDASATDFIHGESVVTIAVIGLMRLANLAGIAMDRSAFPVF